MKLADLCGEHYFSGIEAWDRKVGEYDCAIVKFTLDNTSYIAIETPKNRCGSVCEELIVSSTPPRNSFPPVAVNCSMLVENFDYKHDVLVVKDAVTNLVVLEIGTEHINDYYSYFRFQYYPEKMACNQINVSSEELCQILFGANQL